jgi:P4 family phage/plasmid primase-like protien
VNLNTESDSTTHPVAIRGAATKPYSIVEGAVNGEIRNLADIYALVGERAVLLPVAKGTKRPPADAWQKTTFEDTQHVAYKARLEAKVADGGNIGVLLGEASDNLVAIDLDSEDNVAEFLKLNAHFENTLRSCGSRGCQFWVRMNGEYPSKSMDVKYADRWTTDKNGKEIQATFAEWRANARQSVLFGVHPNGNRYSLLTAKPAMTIAFSEINWPGNTTPPGARANGTKPKKNAANKTSAKKADAEFSNWIKRFKKDLRSLDVRKLVAAFGFIIAFEDGEKITMRCPREGMHTNASSDRDLAIYFPTGAKYPTAKCFHTSCGFSDLQSFLNWVEEQKPGLVDECCRREFTAGLTDEIKYWSQLEGTVAEAAHKEIGPIRCVEDKWFAQREGIWKPTKRDIYRPVALKHIPDSWRTEAHSMCVIRRIEGERQVSRDIFCGAAKFDSDGSVLLAVKNGVLRIPVGEKSEVELLPPNPDYGFTMALPVNWNKDATCKEFANVLCQSLPDAQDRELLLDVLATALIPDCRWEATLVLQGEAGTGKSTVMAPITGIFGGTCSSLSMIDLCHPNGYKLADLEGKLINLATELNTLEIDDTGLFKQLVSGERFTARKIYGEPFEMSSTATLVFLANSLPRFKHGTDAEARRLRFVKFSHRPKKPDVMLKPRVAAEAEGVFAELVRRAHDLLSGTPISEQGKYGQEIARRFQISNDPMGQFVGQSCELCADKWCAKTDLVTAFDDFRDRNAIPMGFDANVFFRNMYDRFQGLKEAQKTVDGFRTRIVKGIFVKPIEDDDEDEKEEKAA